MGSEMCIRDSHMATYAVGKEDGGIVDDDDAAEDDDDERNPVEG